MKSQRVPLKLGLVGGKGRLLLALGLVFVIGLTASGGGQSGERATEDLNVLTGSAEFPSLRRMLPDSLRAIAFKHLSDRQRQVAGFTARKDIEQRQQRIREKFLRAIGGLPERTPLNPKVVGTLKRSGYRIEKIIFESQPAFYVTANLYVPETGQPPYPGILLPLGHENGAKAHEAWQRLAVTFAKNGFVVLTYDPIGQGERVQLYDPDTGVSKASYGGRSTTEHTQLGLPCLLLGHSTARHQIWDGIRALDYLASRPEVDAARIGCTGNSGGGTLTAYLTALDDRIKAAVPSCYITSWKSLLDTLGPQDAEQNLLPFLADGMDQADFVIAAAPRPYLIAAAVRDFFPIQGTRETYREVKRLYGLLGAEEKMSLVEADDGHGFTLPRRLAAYRWMNRWLRGQDAPIEEPAFELESEEDLRCTPSGQVTVSLGGETVWSMTAAEAGRVQTKRVPLATAAALRQFQEEVRVKAGRLTGFEKVTADLKMRHLGELGRPGYRIEKLVYESEPGIVIPSLLFIPEGAGKRRPVLYLHDWGKAAEAGAGREIEDLVRGGALVLAIDLRGTGETVPETDGDTEFYYYFGLYDVTMRALQLNKTLVGLRAQDITRAVDLLVARDDVAPESLTAYGRGNAAVALLHAAALDQRIRQVALENMMLSYKSIATHKGTRRVFESTIPGVLLNYDLPDLAASLAPRPLWLLNGVNPRGQRLDLAQIKAEFETAQSAFDLAGAGAAFVIAERKPGQGLSALIAPPGRGASGPPRR